MTKVARQWHDDGFAAAPAALELRTDDALNNLEDPEGSPARALQARVLAYAQGAEAPHAKYPGWARVGILMGGAGLCWGMVALAASALLG